MAKGFKTGGRAKGTPNKVTKEVRESIQLFVEQELEQVRTMVEEMKPKDRLSFLIKLLPYALPKLTPEKPQLEDQEIIISCTLEEEEKRKSVESFLSQFEQ